MKMKFNSVEVVQLIDMHLRDFESLPRANVYIEEHKQGAMLDASACSGDVWRISNGSPWTRASDYVEKVAYMYTFIHTFIHTYIHTYIRIIHTYV